jgi:hypothetical protein
MTMTPLPMILSVHAHHFWFHDDKEAITHDILCMREDVIVLDGAIRLDEGLLR